METSNQATEQDPKGRYAMGKPCEDPSGNDYSCLGCQHFDECQLSEVVNIKAEMKLDDDY